MTIGIRPEHTLIDQVDQAEVIPIGLDLIETLGSEALIHGHVGSKAFVSKAETHGEITHLKGVSQLFVKKDLIKVFDGKTGLAYGHPGTS